jgi:hypothetical protein
VSEHQRDWDGLAAIATYSYNTKPHPSTGFTPSELVTAIPQVSLMAQVVLAPHRKERRKAEIRNEFLATVSLKGCSRELDFLRTTSQSTGGSSVFIDFGHCLQ